MIASAQPRTATAREPDIATTTPWSVRTRGGGRGRGSVGQVGLADDDDAGHPAMERAAVGVDPGLVEPDRSRGSGGELGVPIAPRRFAPVTRWFSSDAFVNVTVVPGATRAVVGRKAHGSSLTFEVSADVGAGIV